MSTIEEVRVAEKKVQQVLEALRKAPANDPNNHLADELKKATDDYARLVRERLTPPFVKTAAWLIALSLGLSIIGRTVSSYQNDAAFVIQHCGQPDRDWVEGGGGSTLVGRHLVYGDYDTALDLFSSGLPARWRLVNVSFSNSGVNMADEEANRRMPCAKGQLHSWLNRAGH